MVNSVDSIIAQIKKEDIDVESQCFAAEEFKNGSKLSRPSMHSINRRAQNNNYDGITASESGAT
uniref:Transposase n=1 Tax=Loa loa TaxID=7209 RepID=A0A1I7VY83_LOALO